MRVCVRGQVRDCDTVSAVMSHAAKSDPISLATWTPLIGADRPSLNFEFLANHGDLLELARLAESNFHTDPNTTLFKMRQLGEQLARLWAKECRLGVVHEETQYSLLQRLEHAQLGPSSNVLGDFHNLRKLGNEAAHQGNRRRQAAKNGLRLGLWLSHSYMKEWHGFSEPLGQLQIPPDPREVIQATFARVHAQYSEQIHALTKARNDAEQRQREAALKLQESEQDKDEYAQLAEEYARKMEEAEEARRAEEAEWKRMRSEMEAAATNVANQTQLQEVRDIRRVDSVKKGLEDLGVEVTEEPGLPASVLNIAQGEAVPQELDGLSEEVLEDLKAIGEDHELPEIKAPKVRIRANGNLTASGVDRFEIQVALLDPNTGVEFERAIGEGFWTDSDGQRLLLPGELRECLDSLAAGPPDQQSGQTPSEWTLDRKLWWGRLRLRLMPFDVDFGRYLESTDAIVVDRLTARLHESEGGMVELRVSAEGVAEEQLTNVVDKMRSLDATPTLRMRDDKGALRRTRLVFGPKAKQAIVRTKEIRRRSESLSPSLIDAPHTLLDPELFDLSEYSERVVGIGAPVYRVSRSMIQDTASGARFQLRQVSGGGFDSEQPSSLDLSDAEREALQAALREALAQGRPYVRFKEAWVRVPSLAVMDGLDEPVSKATARGSLVVSENLDAQEFAVGDTGHGYLAKVPERPPGLADEFNLLEHQKWGWAWLAGHAGVGERASDHGMLADDMGLGKTLQVLSLLSLLKDSGKLGPSLVVAPLSLLPNWEKEADRFFPGRFTRRIRLGAGRRMKAEDLRGYDLVLASYETVRSQQIEMGRVAWQMMVCDESHRFRNPTAQTTHAIYAMDARYRIALTGTPVHNSLRDIWAQFDWLAPGFLGDLRSFTQNYQGAAIMRDPTERTKRLGVLKKQLESRVLRRLKEQEIADKLPPVEEREIRLDFDVGQRALYDQILGEFQAGHIKAMEAMTQMFQVCAAPSVCVFADDDGAMPMGPKLRWLCAEVLKIRERGERVVVFAEWYKIQDVIASALSAVLGEQVDRINGTVETGLRLAKIEAFNQGQNGTVLVLGPKAAGVGLNITGANHVIHFTRHWNPALESQATDRVYRIGQTKPVTVYRPVMVHPELTSIEEHLSALLENKQKLAKDILVGIEELSVQAELQAIMDGA